MERLINDFLGDESSFQLGWIEIDGAGVHSTHSFAVIVVGVRFEKGKKKLSYWPKSEGFEVATRTFLIIVAIPNWKLLIN